MTKQEIIASINAKIEGQGSAIDAGSALPGILRGILDLIPEGPIPYVPDGAFIDVGELSFVDYRAEITEQQAQQIINASGIYGVGGFNPGKAFFAGRTAIPESGGVVWQFLDKHFPTGWMFYSMFGNWCCLPDTPGTIEGAELITVGNDPDTNKWYLIQYAY